MVNFEYITPTSLKDLPRLLAGETHENVVLAGGTDLLDRLKERLIRPRRVINIKNLAELRGVTYEDGLKIGALTTISELAADRHIRENYPALAQAAAAIATPQLRNMGTIGGNLTQRPRCWYFRGKEYHCLKKGGEYCFAVDGLNKYHAILGGGPCYITHPSDSAPALIALNASIDIMGPSGTQTMPLAEFFHLPEKDVRSENVLKADQLITHVTVPASRAGTRSLYLKFREKQSLDFAVSGVAAVLTFNGDTVQQARLVLSGVAPVPWRSRDAEAALTGQALTDKAIEAASEAAVADSAPLAQNGYKVQLTQNLVKRALEQLRQG